MSAGFLVAIALAAALVAAVAGRRGAPSRAALLAGAAGLALYSVSAAALDPMGTLRLADTPFALGMDGALVTAAAGTSLLLVLVISLATPDPAERGDAPETWSARWTEEDTDPPGMPAAPGDGDGGAAGGARGRVVAATREAADDGSGTGSVARVPAHRAAVPTSADTAIGQAAASGRAAGPEWAAASGTVAVSAADARGRTDLDPGPVPMEPPAVAPANRGREYVRISAAGTAAGAGAATVRRTAVPGGATIASAALVPGGIGALAALAALAASVGALNGALMTPTAGASGTRALLVAPAIVLAASAAAAVLAAPLVAARPGPPALEAVRTASRTLRVAVLGGACGLAGAGWLLASEGTVAADANGIAAALLLMAGGFALLAGSMPFHALAARAAGSGSWLLLAARSAWIPAAFGLGAIGWEQHVLLPALGYGGLETTSVVTAARAVIVVAALVTLAGSAVVATLRDDLRHVAVYAIVADWALVLAALAFPDAAGSAAARDWIPLNALAKTALVAWCVAVAGTFGSSKLDDLAGWARRAPLLAAALVGVAAATFGFPGSGMLSLRPLVAEGDGAAGGIAMLAASWLGLLPYLRLAAVGLRAPSAAVAAAPGELPVRSSAAARAEMASRPAGVARFAGAGARDVGARVGRVLAANAVPIAAVVTLATALLALTLAWAVGGRPTLVD